MDVCQLCAKNAAELAEYEALLPTIDDYEDRKKLMRVMGWLRGMIRGHTGANHVEAEGIFGGAYIANLCDVSPNKK